MPPWVHLVAIGVLFLTIFGMGWKTGYDHRAARVPAELAAQLKADTAQCNADKKLTKEASDGYQTHIADLNSRLARTKLLYASQPCVPVTGIARGSNGASGDKGLPAAHGVAATALIEYGGDAERVGVKLDALQGFVQRVWAAKSASTSR